MTTIAGSSNVLVPEARAKISMRIVPGSDPEKELDALVAHLETHAPWGAQVEVSARRRRRRSGARPTAPATPPPAGAGGGVRQARRARPAPAAPSRCCARSQKAAPDAEFILWGPEDVAGSRIHASDESVDPAEIEKMVVAQALLLQQFAER